MIKININVDIIFLGTVLRGQQHSGLLNRGGAAENVRLGRRGRKRLLPAPPVPRVEGRLWG